MRVAFYVGGTLSTDPEKERISVTALFYDPYYSKYKACLAWQIAVGAPAMST